MDVAGLWPDEEKVEVSGGGLSAVVLPARGGKIISLRDSRGIEWLASPDRAVGAPARPGDNFLLAEMAGWDECAPTIVECEVDGISLADHGELWTKSFHVDQDAVWADDDTLGYRFRREIHATHDGLMFSYSATAGPARVPFLWAAHPQLRAPAGSRVFLPDSVARVVDVMDPNLPELTWSDALATVDTIPSGGYRKVYVHPDERASFADLVHPDGAALRMAWSTECPYVGLWFDKFAYRADPIIAIEPSTAYFDSLATAIDLGRYPSIQAGETFKWTVSLSTLTRRESSVVK